MGSATFGVNNNIVELSFPKLWLGNNVDNFRLVFYGENIAFPGGTVEDYYPNGAMDNQTQPHFFQYGFQ